MSEILLVNPRRRRKAPVRRRKTAVRKRRRNPVAANPRRRRKTAVRRRRSYRRNPSSRLTARNIQNQVMGAVPGAFGALALDISLGYIPLPAMLTGTPLMSYLTKGVAAIALGAVANATKLVKPATANQMTQGALTVMIHGALKQSVGQFAPNIPMGAYMDYTGLDGLGYAGSGWNPNAGDVMDPDALGTYLPSLSSEQMTTDQYGLGEYLPGNIDGEY